MKNSKILNEAKASINEAERAIFALLQGVNHTFPDDFDHLGEGLTFMTCDNNGYPIRAYIAKIEGGMVEVRDFEIGWEVFTDRVDMLETQEAIRLAEYFFGK